MALLSRISLPNPQAAQTEPRPAVKPEPFDGGSSLPSPSLSSAAPATTPPPMLPSQGVDVDLGALKSVSRHHARIAFRPEEGAFVLEVLGRNGCWVDDQYFAKGSQVLLSPRSVRSVDGRVMDEPCEPLDAGGRLLHLARLPAAPRVRRPAGVRPSSQRLTRLDLHRVSHQDQDSDLNPDLLLCPAALALFSPFVAVLTANADSLAWRPDGFLRRIVLCSLALGLQSE